MMSENLAIDVPSDDDVTPRSKQSNPNSRVQSSDRGSSERKAVGHLTPSQSDQGSFDQLPREQTSSPKPKRQDYSRCVIVSWKIRQLSLLTKAVKGNVILHQYKSDSTLETILVDVSNLLGGQKVASVAFISHGNPGTVTVCQDKVKIKKFKFITYTIMILTKKWVQW